MRQLMLTGTVLAVGGLLAVTAVSQPAAPPANRVTLYVSTPLEGDPTREVRLQTIVLPPGASNNFHRHPGDQWTTVQEGEITYTIKGQPPRLMKVGDSVHTPRGVVHRNQNLSDKSARTVEVVIVDKDKPRTEEVRE